MYRILLPVDANTDRAMAQARYVAGLPNASDTVEVSILHVFDDDDRLDPETDESTRSPDDIEAVARIQQFFTEHDIEQQTLKDRQDPVEAILAQAEAQEVNTIVLGGRKRSPAGKVLFGSVTMSVLRNTDIPVVVTGHTD